MGALRNMNTTMKRYLVTFQKLVHRTAILARLKAHVYQPVASAHTRLIQLRKHVYVVLRVVTHVQHQKRVIPTNAMRNSHLTQHP